MVSRSTRAGIGAVDETVRAAVVCDETELVELGGVGGTGNESLQVGKVGIDRAT